MFAHHGMLNGDLGGCEQLVVKCISFAMSLISTRLKSRIFHVIHYLKFRIAIEFDAGAHILFIDQTDSSVAVAGHTDAFRQRFA